MDRHAARRLVLLAGAVLVAGSGAFAQLSDQGGPIRVSADRSSVMDREREVIMTGNVDIIQGDARLRADTVTLSYSGGSAGSGVGGGFGDIRSMFAEGEGFYITPDLRARGDTGEYIAETERITLSGEVVLIRCNDVARGKQLVINVAAGTSTLSGGDGRVGMFIEPSDESRDCQGD